MIEVRRIVERNRIGLIKKIEKISEDPPEKLSVTLVIIVVRELHNGKNCLSS
ncbi:MAG: hypothetical protein J7K33_09255 [Candidatus Marinimicrobia bacterium]|nr:hypothetical protein [Candidatus Neomarinimicrobiota bacterium]